MTPALEFHRKLLTVATADVGRVSEIKGPEDHPKIELAHSITKIESGLAQKAFSDEIPWCASIMTLWMLIAGAQQNPGLIFRWLATRSQTHLFSKIMAYADPLWKNRSEADKESFKTMTTGIWVPRPTFTAWALDWKTWGVPVELKDAQPGDLAVFSRGSGGHVAIYLAHGWATVTVLGGNQNNAVCAADWYLRSKLITVRRAAQ